MENTLAYHFPIDPMLLIAGFSVLTLVLLIVVIVCIVKMNKLYRRYDLFMRGKDAESLEDTLHGIIEELADLHEKDRASRDAMKVLSKQIRNSFQKFGYVKYNAFTGMGGNLSFAIAVLDSNNSGFVLDVVHSQDGCYLYLKEVEEGATEVLLGNEEQEALEQALGYIKRPPLGEQKEKKKKLLRRRPGKRMSGEDADQREADRRKAGSGEQSIEVPNSEREKSERLKELRRKQEEARQRSEQQANVQEKDIEKAEQYEDGESAEESFQEPVFAIPVPDEIGIEDADALTGEGLSEMSAEYERNY